MAKEQSPAFQFYPKDWLSDDRVMAMTPAQRGCYVQLLATCWLAVKLPDDPVALANISGVSELFFSAEIWPAVGACFQRDGKFLRHKRLDEERRKQRVFRKRASSAGQAAAKQRLESACGALKSNSSISVSDLRSSVQDHTEGEPKRLAYGGHILELSHRQHEVLVRMCNAVPLDLLGEVYPRWDRELEQSGEPFDPLSWCTAQLSQEVGIRAPAVPTEADFREAEGILRRIGGDCQHFPPCADRESCVAKYAVRVMLKRMKPLAVRA